VLIMRCFCLAMLGLCAAVAGSARFLLGHVRVLERFAGAEASGASECDENRIAGCELCSLSREKE
jgi:hypothetical protein